MPTKTSRPTKRIVHWRINADNLDYLESVLAEEGVSSLPGLANLIFSQWVKNHKAKS